MSLDREESTTYRVLVNQLDEYSIVPVDGEIPDGWRDVGKEGAKAECLAFIDRAWTDMRPRSVRVAMQTAALR
jgi:MbtH protein